MDDLLGSIPWVSDLVWPGYGLRICILPSKAGVAGPGTRLRVARDQMISATDSGFWSWNPGAVAPGGISGSRHAHQSPVLLDSEWACSQESEHKTSKSWERQKKGLPKAAWSSLWDCPLWIMQVSALLRAGGEQAASHCGYQYPLRPHAEFKVYQTAPLVPGCGRRRPDTRPSCGWTGQFPAPNCQVVQCLIL